MQSITQYIYLVFIILGVLLTLYGFISYKKDKNRLLIKRCSAQTVGHVTGFDDSDKIVKVRRQTVYRESGTYYRKKKTFFYVPYVEFEDESGEKIEALYKRPLEKKLSTGQKINIKYNPKNPYEFIISGDRNVQIFSVQAIFLGILLIAGGIFLFVNNFFL